MVVELQYSEISQLSEMMHDHRHIAVIGDDGAHLLDVYDHYDLESVYATLDIVSDPDLLELVREGMEQAKNGSVVVVDMEDIAGYERLSGSSKSAALEKAPNPTQKGKRETGKLHHPSLS